MTLPPVVHLEVDPPSRGCVQCGSQRTVQISSYTGRLCPSHAVLPTIPPGPYQRALALEMVDLGRADCAWAYLRAWLVAEAGRRFAAVTP